MTTRRASRASPGQDELRALEARIAHLEQVVQGLQDSVHRESTRLGKRIGELEARIQPAALGRALSEDARQRRVWRPVTAFSFPGIATDARAGESASGEIRRQTELELGRPPGSRRIVGLSTRWGGVDCIAGVVRLDPLRGGIVVAAFDMGPHQPFVVWCQQELGQGRCGL